MIKVESVFEACMHDISCFIVRAADIFQRSTARLISFATNKNLIIWRLGKFKMDLWMEIIRKIFPLFHVENGQDVKVSVLFPQNSGLKY